MTRDVTWHGLKARYSPDELAKIRRLTPKERLFVHAAKALFAGRLR